MSEAKEVLRKLCLVTENARTLEADDLFVECLQGELTAAFKDNNTINCSFYLSESGEVIYRGIQLDVRESSDINISINRNTMDSVENSLVADSEIGKFINESKIKRTELLNTNNTIIENFDKLLAETVQGINDRKLKETKDRLELENLQKKQQLLDKLLKERT